jgi:pseudouridine-5'-monophosphatase
MLLAVDLILIVALIATFTSRANALSPIMTLERTTRTPTIKAIIFDLDGTLLDTEALSDKAMFASLPLPVAVQKRYEADHRLPWEVKKQILGLRSSDWGPIMINYAKEKWGVEDLPTVAQLGTDWEENLSSYCEQVQACPGALELVEMFAAANLPMAIATSSHQSAVAKKRKNHGVMFQHFQAVICGDHPAVLQGKPAPDIYLEAARQLGVDPKECLVFEDALTGVRAAKAAYCHVVAVPDPRFDADEKATFATDADVVLESLWQFSGQQFGIDVTM